MQTDEHRDPRRLYPWVGVLAGLVLVVAAAWAADFIPGDVNDDGVFDIADPTVLRRELAGLGPGISQPCGNGLLDPNEDCDFGVICPDLGFAFGELVCGEGCVVEVDTCTNSRFEDLGLTVFDHQTGLEWEKKTGAVGSFASCAFFPDSVGTCADLSNVNNRYTWDDATGEWESRLNGPTNDQSGASQLGLAGQTDWRVPTLAELLTIFDPSAPGCGVNPFTVPCIDSILGPTRPSRYWSSSSRTHPLLSGAWTVSFLGGGVQTVEKFGPGFPPSLPVRAVRSGPPTCGDGLLNQASEECDSPNDSACPGACSSDCTCLVPSTCGDGVVNQIGEDCDALDDSACPGQCQPDCTCPVPEPTCGDGTVNQPSEQCDDGNNQSEDCCSSVCQFESGSCAPDGNVCTDDVCDGAGACTHPISTPGCDDGNPCTDDLCDPFSGCVSTFNNSNQCDDGDACTSPDQCQNGSCVGSPLCTSPIPDASSVCISGSCEIGSCVSTFYDVNQTYSDGCECQEDSADQAGVGDGCFTPHDLGTLPDDGVSQITFTGNLVPGQDSDWFRVILSDSNDAVDAAISFSLNPSNQFKMYVFMGGCGPGDQECPVIPSGLGSYNYKGAAGPDDTVGIWVQVFREGFFPANCDSYTLQVGHVSSGGGPNCSTVVP